MARPAWLPPDHHVQPLIAGRVQLRLAVGSGHWAASGVRATLKLNIMPLCMCSAI